MADSSFFQSYKGTVQPGDLFTIHRRGRSVAMVAASDDLEIVINDGSRSRFFAGASLSFDVEFEKIQIYNPNGTAADFELWTAMGRVDDNRLTASGDLNVIDPNTGDSFAEVIAKNAEILAMMQNANDQRIAISEIGASKADGICIAGYIELVPPASNVNGLIVRHAVLSSGVPAVSLISKPTPPANVFDGVFLCANDEMASLNRPFYLSPGSGLYVWCDSANGRYSVGWDYMP